MPSPFPGMNPYLEAPFLWREVHNEQGNFDLRVDYTQPIPEPALSERDRAWVQQCIL